nr:reverse transcriptase domain-containing protein [Tanacetum cinerariifolium]
MVGVGFGGGSGAVSGGGGWCGFGGGETMVRQRVGGGGVWDRVDRLMRSLFGFAGKSPPKKFSGGDVVVVGGGRLVAGGGCRIGREREMSCFDLICDTSDYAVGAVLGQRIKKKFHPIYYASKTMYNAQEHYTTTEKELSSVVYSFDKFRSYLIMSKTMVYTNHSALKYIFSKQDAKPRLIRWVLLLQEFTIETKDKKRTENLATDQLSRLENPGIEELNEDTIQDNFPGEHLMVIKLKDAETNPWYVDYANFLVSKIVPQHLTYYLRKKFFNDVRKYIWDDPYLFKSCPDGIIRRFVFGRELQEILEHYHKGPTRGHCGADITA